MCILLELYEDRKSAIIYIIFIVKESNLLLTFHTYLTVCTLYSIIEAWNDFASPTPLHSPYGLFGKQCICTFKAFAEMMASQRRHSFDWTDTEIEPKF